MTPTYPGLLAQELASTLGFSSVDISADAAIEQTVRSMLADSPLSRTASISVAVREGAVTLDGTVSDGLLLARFKNQVTSALPRVTINDQLEWVVPDCGVGVV